MNQYYEERMIYFKDTNRVQYTSIFLDDAKSMEISGLSPDDTLEPEDVKVAREELKVLHEEKHRTEKLRSTVSKELESAKSKTKRLQDVRYLFIYNVKV